jgi:hypothetical protein
VLLVGAFGVAIAVEERRTGAWRAAFRASPDLVGLGAGLAAAGVGLAVACMRPPEDFFPGGGDPGTFTIAGGIRALTRLGWAYAPIPSNAEHPWNSVILPALPAIAAGLAALALVHWIGLRGRPIAAAFFWSGSAALLAFAFAIYPGLVRHALHYQVVAIAALWLAAHEGGAPYRAGAPRWALVALLAPSVVATAWLAAADLRMPFSNAKAMAAWMRAAKVEPAAVMAAPDFATSGVGTWLDRPLYLLAAREPRRFVKWTRGRFVTDEALYAPLRAAMGEGRPVWLLLNHPIAPAEAPLLGGTPVLRHAETGAILHDEDFWLYQVTASRP